jgi:hypothetical protein
VLSPGGVSHEAAAGIVALSGYLRVLASALDPVHGRDGSGGPLLKGCSGGGGGSGGSSGSGRAAHGAGGSKSIGNAADGAAAGTPAAGSPAVAQLQRPEVVAALEAAAALEAPLAGPIVEFLQAHPLAILIGPGTLAEAGPSSSGSGGGSQAGSSGCGAGGAMHTTDHGWCERVPTVSFVPVSKTSAEVAAAVQVCMHSGMFFVGRRLAQLLSWQTRVLGEGLGLRWVGSTLDLRLPSGINSSTENKGLCSLSPGLLLAS